MMMTTPLKIALGPLQYYWPRDAVFSFYETMAATPVDLVYLGETVCSRRHELRLADWLDIAGKLQDAGKAVVLSTQVLLESGAEVATMHKITANGRFLVEANDMGAVQQLAGNLPTAACRWPFRRAASPPGTATCPRTIAASAASSTLTACCSRPASVKSSW
jgi:hypothetical protein